MKKSRAKGTGNPQAVVRLPAERRGKLEADADKYGCTVQAMLLWIAGQWYGVDVADPARGRPKG